MANEKRLIDANALKEQIAKEIHTYWTNGTGGYYIAEDVIPDIDNAPTVDAVPVDTVVEMFEYFLGDCPCNYSPTDGWLPECCELQEECPNPKDR